MKILSTAIVMLTITIVLSGCEPSTKEKHLEKFITAHVEKIKPIMKEANLAYWNAAITGSSENYNKYSKLQLKIRQIYSNPEEFTFLRDIKESGQVKDAKLARQLDELYNAYLENQIEPQLLKKIVDLGTGIEKNFSTFRGTISGKKVTTNEIKEILKTETDSVKRKKAWLARKQVGPVVAREVTVCQKLPGPFSSAAGSANLSEFRPSISTSTRAPRRDSNPQPSDRQFEIKFCKYL
ncbi:hypothetical protein ES703_79259 [subsurface metagenome]